MDQGQGQEPSGQGTAQALGLILPLAGLAAGIVRPQTAPAFAALGQQGHYMAQQQNAQNELARKDAESQRKAAGQAATAQDIQNIFGLPVSANQDPTTQLALLTAQEGRSKFAAEEEGRRHGRAQDQEGRDAYGRLGGVRQRVGGNESVEALESSVRNLSPSTFRDPATMKELADTQAAIAAHAKRQSDADAAVRGTQGGPALEGVPLPENVAAYRKHVMASGVDPKAAETSAMQFGLPIGQVPGGLAAQREAVKPPYHTAQPFTDAQGRVTIAATSVHPQTGQTTTQHTQLPGTPGQPQQPPTAGMADIARSMQAIISGQPQLAMPQDRNMTPQTAAAVLTSLRAVNAAAQAQASPDLAFKVISDQRDASARKIDELKAQSLSKQGTAQGRAKAASEMTQEQMKLDRYDSMLEPFISSGMRNLPGGPPPAPTAPRPGGEPSPTRKRLQSEGVLKP